MRKVALIIGNDSYEELKPLSSAKNDANGMNTKLTQLGFDCYCNMDVKYYDMGSILTNFENELDNYEVGLVYFAGHGFEVDKCNYLAMIDTGLDLGGVPVKHHAYKLDDFIEAFEKSKLSVKIIILDACREDLSEGIRGSAVGGFAPTFAPKGTIIAYSTSPGQKSIERNKNGVYTRELLKCIDLPRVRIEDMFKKVRAKVCSETNNRQVPWEHTSLLGDFYFNPDLVSDSSMILYSNTALADSTYMFVGDSKLRRIINDLKSYDWYQQNPAVDSILKMKREEWDVCSNNEVFILGRNIYQAAVGGSIRAGDFIECISTRLSQLPDKVANHILCGMSYEIYFDSKGKLRDRLKINFFIEVVQALEQNAGEPLKFIQQELSKYDERIIYIPGSEQDYIIAIKIEGEELTDLQCNGQSVLYGTERYGLFEIGTVMKNKKELETMIEDKMAVLPERISFVYSEEIENIEVPYDFTIKWFDNSSSLK